MRKLKLLAILLIVAVGITACGDSGSNATNEDPPDVPDLGSVQPETEFFNTSTKIGEASDAISTTTGFDNAQTIVQGTIEPLFNLSKDLAVPMMEEAQNNDPEFKDGSWEWSYSDSQSGIAVDIRLVATVNETSGETSWEFYISTSGTSGASFDNYKFMDGTAAEDGSSGSWNIYPYDPSGGSEAVISFDWNKNDTDDLSATFTVNASNSTETFTIEFEENSVEHTLTMSGGGQSVEIFWNSDTNAGYIIADGQKVCWDANYQNTQCS